MGRPFPHRLTCALVASTALVVGGSGHRRAEQSELVPLTAGMTVERTITVAELTDADEIFSTGNHGKVMPCVRYEDKAFAAGPIAAKARELYWAFAHQQVVAGGR